MRSLFYEVQLALAFKAWLRYNTGVFNYRYYHLSNKIDRTVVVRRRMKPSRELPYILTKIGQVTFGGPGRVGGCIGTFTEDYIRGPRTFRYVLPVRTLLGNT